MKRILTSIVLLSLLFSCVPIQSLILGRPGKKDASRFKSKIISANTECFQFKASQKPLKLMVNNWTSDLPEFENIDSVCMQHRVRELLVIQNDSLVYHFRKNGFTEQSLHSSYSISKSVVSCLIGIAIDDGYFLYYDELISNNIQCLKPSRQTFRCQVYNNGQLDTSSI